VVTEGEVFGRKYNNDIYPFAITDSFFTVDGLFPHETYPKIYLSVCFGQVCDIYVRNIMTNEVLPPFSLQLDSESSSIIESYITTSEGMVTTGDTDSNITSQQEQPGYPG